MSLWLHFLEAGEWNKRRRWERATSVFKGCQTLFCEFAGSPCRWKVKAVSVKDVLRLVSVLIGLLARGPGREKSRTLTVLCYTKQALLTPSSTCSCLSCVEPSGDSEFRYTPGVSQDIENTPQGTEHWHSRHGHFSHVFPLTVYTVCKCKLIESGV